MNILFYTYFKVSPTKGGTERTTITVATGLKTRFGCHCYSLFSVDAETVMESCFDEEVCWHNGDIKTVCEFVRRHQIDWIINQGVFGVAKAFGVISSETNCKVVFVHHFEPGWEGRTFTFRGAVAALKSSTSVKEASRNAIDVFLFPLMRWRYGMMLRRQYHAAYELSDRTVLLSQNYIPLYMSYGRVADNRKFKIIHNALSFNEQFPISGIAKKKSVVLIVSRLDEVQKRLSLALEIWKEVKKYRESDGWMLKIVGHGKDEEKYRRMIWIEAIPDVQLLGRKASKPFYEEASIYLMTSRSEGQPLTLSEAQQFGVVPIVFDTFASLVDIVTDREDGIVIPECDMKAYVSALMKLMTNNDWRETIAQNAIRNSRRFSQETIAKSWWKLLSE